jgi:diacylglycerol kinase
LKILLATQPNARVHLAAGILAVVAGFIFELATWEWVALIFAIGGVWITEALNTAIEFTVDLASPEHHELAGWAKDVAAGAVLIASIVALVIGALLFAPKIFLLLKQAA